MTPQLLRSLAVCLLAYLFFAGCSSSSRPGDATAEKGIQAYLEGDYETATKELKSGLSAGVKEEIESEVWTILGNSHDRLGQFHEAVVAYAKALEYEPDSAKVWTNLGATYRHMNDFQKAEVSYRRALELDPNYAEAHASLGALFIFQSKKEEAISSLEKALQLNGELAGAQANIAVAYAATGRFQEADASLAKANSLGFTNGPAIRSMIDKMKSKEPVEVKQEVKPYLND